MVIALSISLFPTPHPQAVQAFTPLCYTAKHGHTKSLIPKKNTIRLTKKLKFWVSLSPWCWAWKYCTFTWNIYKYILSKIQFEFSIRDFNKKWLLFFWWQYVCSPRIRSDKESNISQRCSSAIMWIHHFFFSFVFNKTFFPSHYLYICLFSFALLPLAFVWCINVCMCSVCASDRVIFNLLLYLREFSVFFFRDGWRQGRVLLLDWQKQKYTRYRDAACFWLY